MTDRYRAFLFRRAQGPWRDSKADAMQDALAAGAASRGTEPWDYDRIYLGAGGSFVIERWQDRRLMDRQVL